MPVSPLPLSKELWLKLGVRDSKERVADVGVWAAQGTALSPGAAAAGSRRKANRTTWVQWWQFCRQLFSPVTGAELSSGQLPRAGDILQPVLKTF